LIEEQKDIVSNLLGKSQDDKITPLRAPLERGLVRSHTTDLDLSALRQKKKAKTLSNKQMNFFKGIVDEEKSIKSKCFERKK
jgi:stress response protein SCP2